MKLSFSEINIDDLGIYVPKIKEWDKKRFFTTDYNVELFGLFNMCIGCFLGQEFIAYGDIHFPILSDERKVDISYIVSPEYRKQGIGTELLGYLLDYCKNELKINTVIVNILKKNKIGIAFIENTDFDFVSFDKYTITYEKKLINK